MTFDRPRSAPAAMFANNRRIAARERTHLPHFLYRLKPARAAMPSDGPTGRDGQFVGAHIAHLQPLADAEGRR